MVESKPERGGPRRLRAVGGPSPREIEPLVMDGPFTETKEMIAVRAAASRGG